MIGKFLSRALMSVVMDKKAREKYDAINSAKKDGKKAAKQPSDRTAAKTPAAAPDADGDLDGILPESLIQQAIMAAEQELDRKKNLPPGRERLIAEALAIQKSKQKLLDDLPKEQREKLTFMAMHAFGNALTDQPAKGKRAPAKKPKKDKP